MDRESFDGAAVAKVSFENLSVEIICRCRELIISGARIKFLRERSRDRRILKERKRENLPRRGSYYSSYYYYFKNPSSIAEKETVFPLPFQPRAGIEIVSFEKPTTTTLPPSLPPYHQPRGIQPNVKHLNSTHDERRNPRYRLSWPSSTSILPSPNLLFLPLLGEGTRDIIPRPIFPYPNPPPPRSKPSGKVESRLLNLS